MDDYFGGFDEQLINETVQTTEKPLKKNKKKKQKYEDIMKNLPKTCFSCVTHPDDYLRHVPEPNSNRPTCKSCGFKCIGNLGYLGCAKTANCYTLCTSCRVCSSNHILRKMFNLKHLSGNSDYENNQFKCHGCKQQKTVDQTKPVHHCTICSFSICSDCITKTESIWRQNERNQDEQN